MHLDFRQSFNRSLATSSWVMLLKYPEFPIPPTTLPTYANLWYNLNGEKHFSSRSMSICSICAFPTSHPPKKMDSQRHSFRLFSYCSTWRETCFPSSTCFIMMECIHPLRVTCRIFAVDHTESSFSIATGLCGGRIFWDVFVAVFAFKIPIDSWQIEGRRIKRIDSATSSRSRMNTFPFESLSISISMIKNTIISLSSKTIHPRTPKHLLTRVLKRQTFPKHRNLRRYWSIFKGIQKTSSVYWSVANVHTTYIE